MERGFPSSREHAGADRAGARLQGTGIPYWGPPPVARETLAEPRLPVPVKDTTNGTRLTGCNLPHQVNVNVVRDARPRGENKPSGAADPDRDESPGKAKGPARAGAATLARRGSGHQALPAARRPRRHQPVAQRLPERGRGAVTAAHRAARRPL